MYREVICVWGTRGPEWDPWKRTLGPSLQPTLRGEDGSNVSNIRFFPWAGLKSLISFRKSFTKHYLPKLRAFCPIILRQSQAEDSSVGIVTGWTAGDQFPAGKREFSLLHVVQIGTGGSFPGRKADHSPPSSAEVKNGGAIPPLPNTSYGVLLN
jgi:hypothetical protein